MAEPLRMPVALCSARLYFIAMVCAISQPPGLRLRRPSESKKVLGGTFCVAFGLRSYSPELGRWINRDPIGEMGGVNSCAMLRNQAIGRIDLLGTVAWDEGDSTVIEELMKELQNHEAFLNSSKTIKETLTAGPLPKEVLHDGKERAMLIYKVETRCQKCEFHNNKPGKPISGHYSTFYALRNMIATGNEKAVYGSHIQAAKDSQINTTIGQLFSLYKEQDGMPVRSPFRSSLRTVPPNAKIRCEITYLKRAGKVHSHPYIDPGPSTGPDGDIERAKTEGSQDALFVIWPENRGGVDNNMFWGASYDGDGELERFVIPHRPE